MHVNPFPNKPLFLHVCCASLLKTLWEKEKLLVKSNFFFSHSVFHGRLFCDKLCQLYDVILAYVRQGVQLNSIPNTTSPHLLVIFTFSATGMKMTIVLLYTAVIYPSTGIQDVRNRYV